MLHQDLNLLSGGLRSFSRFFYLFLFTSHISMFSQFSRLVSELSDQTALNLAKKWAVIGA